MTIKKIRKSLFPLILFIALLLCPSSLFALTISFNSTSDLTSNFNPDSSPVYTNVSTGGISNTGVVNFPLSYNECWTLKNSFSVSGSATYTYSTYFKIGGNSGYSGLGFTIANQNEPSTFGNPSTAIGVTFHGGAGIWINNGSSTNLGWSVAGDLAIGNWYKMTYTLTHTGGNNFNETFEIYNSDADGVLGSQKTSNSRTGTVNANIGSASIIYPYFSNSGSRASAIDNFYASAGLSSEPTTQATGASFTSPTTISLTVNWTRGNGSSCIVLMKSGSAVNSDPSDGTPYTANSAFGAGSQIGTGNYVVYKGTETSVAVTNLNASTTYYVKVYEFNGSGDSENYLTPGVAGNTTTRSIPVIAQADPLTATMDEDGSPTPWSTPTITASDGDSDTLAWSLFTAASNGSVTVSGSSVPPSSPSALTYSPDSDFNGLDSFVVQVADADGNDTITVNVTVNAVNDTPSFVKGADQTVSEDAGAQTVNGWATSISKGPADESGQTLTFNAGNNNNSLFSAQPAVDASGNLAYTPAADAIGSATVTVSLSDSGGGTDTSGDQTFTITVNAVNDTPSFVKGADQTVNEDAGAQTVNGWATSISEGPADESGQTLTFNAGNNNNSLFSEQPAVDASGNLTYTPGADACGSATVTVSLSDSGSGADTSGDQTFTITVNAVNDTPSFVKGADQTVNEDAGAQNIPGWATAISKGPADESGQTLAFSVSNNNNGLFSVQPATDASGNLTYTPAADVNGSATVTLSLSDNGGGADTSGNQSFTITVNAVNDTPSFAKGADQTVNEDAGAQTVNGWATAIAKGPAEESGQTLTFDVNNNNNGLFSTQPATDASGNLTYTPAADANGSATVTLSLSDNGGGADTSGNQSFVINVNAVNDTPS
ncbi:MAG: tandem-95 repeat protein, partial [Gammaproteobacteria bacterium]|nr:tandem-95 repeat protein [Gammaproteobacteria bacterium]